MEHSTNKYIREVYYFDYEDEDSDAISDIQRLVKGDLSIEELRQTIEKSKIADEKEHGDEIYKTSN